MREDEYVSTYLTRLFDITNHMKSYGKELNIDRIVQKILISLARIFYGIVFVIEHSKLTEEMKLQEMVGPLKASEQRLERHVESAPEKGILEP